MIFNPFRKKMSFLRRNGQILIPSLLVIPSLLIFVFLLFETAKLSREKIRQQFAIDSAVFIQMGDYTNIFNRTAYINGAFPYRTFKEVYGCEDPSNYRKHTNESDQKCLWEMLFDSGAIPKNINDNNPDAPPLDFEITEPWKIGYKDNNSETGDGRPGYDTPVESDDLIGTLWMFSKHHGVYYWGVNYDFVTTIYNFYVEAYTVFGQIEDSQWTVFERITKNSTFLRQSYYFNANTPECNRSINSCADEAVSFFSRVNVSSIFKRKINKIGFYAKKAGTTQLNPYDVVKTSEPSQMLNGGLFQLAGFNTSTLKQIGNGIDVYQGWRAPANYFNVDFNRISACRETGKPCVHAKITSQCPKFAHSTENNCVWPNPTPKYQTRLYP